MTQTGSSDGSRGVTIPTQRRARGVTVPPPEADVEASVEMRDAVTGTPVRAAFTYAMSDPHAVWIFFDVGAGAALLPWVIGRDLLHSGLYDYRGSTSLAGDDGDVSVEAEHGSNLVYINLRSPDGAVALEADRPVIAGFMRETARRVPIGTEAGIAVGLVEEAVERILAR